MNESEPTKTSADVQASTSCATPSASYPDDDQLDYEAESVNGDG